MVMIRRNFLKGRVINLDSRRREAIMLDFLQFKKLVRIPESSQRSLESVNSVV